MTNTTKFYKLSDEDYENLSEDQIIQKLEPNIQEIIKDEIESYKFGLIDVLVGSESPIERMLLLKLKRVLIESHVLYTQGLDVPDIDSQELIECGGNKYRVDILIPVWSNIKKQGRMFIVECDGHDFHERTKEQVEKDNKRTRDLMKHGYTVLRFSGSEIYKDALQCAFDVRNVILDAFKG